MGGATRADKKHKIQACPYILWRRLGAGEAGLDHVGLEHRALEVDAVELEGRELREENLGEKGWEGMGGVTESKGGAGVGKETQRRRTRQKQG